MRLKYKNIIEHLIIKDGLPVTKKRVVMKI